MIYLALLALESVFQYIKVSSLHHAAAAAAPKSIQSCLQLCATP